MHAKFNANTAQNEKPQNDHQRKIKAAEAGCIKQREGKVQSSAASQQPDFVSVPHGANGANHSAALLVSFGDEQMQNAGAKVETVENYIRGDHDRNEPEPYEKHSSSFS